MNKILKFKKIVSISFFAVAALFFIAQKSADANFFSDMFNGSGSQSIAASSSSSSYNLKVYKSGKGIVTSDDGKINCGRDCKEKYSSNIYVALTAKPDTGYDFYSWGRDCSGKAETCSITMNKSKSAKAYFKKQKALKTSRDEIQGGNISSVSSSGVGKKYGITVKKSGVGSVKSDPLGINCTSGQNNRDKNVCSAEFSYGQPVVLYANPDVGSGYETGTWGGDCRNTVKGSPCRLTADKKRDVTVSFDLKQSGQSGGNVYKLTIIKTGNGDGKVESKSVSEESVINTNVINCGADCSENIKSNCQSDESGILRCASVQLKATAIGESTFGWWGGDCTDNWLKSAKDECVIYMNGNKEITAVFNEGYNNQAGVNYKLTAQKPIGGTITNKNGSGRIDCGTNTNNCSSNYGKDVTVNLTATPDNGYKFKGTGDNWGTGCDKMVGSNECQVKMNKNRTISASFEKINVLGTPKGTVSAATNVTSNSATLNGRVNPAGRTVKVGFSYHRNVNGSDMLFTPLQTVTGTSDISIKADITNLSVETTYVYNMTLSYFDETTNTAKNIGSSNATNFTTLGSSSSSSSSLSSVLITREATNVTSTSAALNGTVKVKTGESFPAYFIYGKKGTDQKTWKQTSLQTITGNGDVSISANISNLSAGTEYEYYLASYFEYGMTKGFKTLTGSSSSSSSISSNSSSSSSQTTASTYKLKVTISGNGRIQDNYSKIDCGSNMACQADYSKGQMIRIKTQDTDSNGVSFGTKVDSWNGGGCSGTSNICDITMDGNKDVTVKFVSK